MDWLLSKNAEETNVTVMKVDVETTEKKDLLCCEVVAVDVRVKVNTRRASNIYTKAVTVAHQSVPTRSRGSHPMLISPSDPDRYYTISSFTTAREIDEEALEARKSSASKMEHGTKLAPRLIVYEAGFGSRSEVS